MAAPQLQVCRTCDVEKEMSEYYKHSVRHGVQLYFIHCKDCMRAKYADASGNTTAWRYSLDPVQLADMLGRGCQACGSRLRLCVDHDHKCCPGGRSCGKCVRGILCNSCNVALALVNDDMDRLRGLIEYLEGR